MPMNVKKMAESPTRPRDAAATQPEILNAAESSLPVQGYGSASLAQIAKNSNTRKSLIFLHFASEDRPSQVEKERRFSCFVKEITA